MMICLAEAHNRTEVGFEQPTFHSGVRHSPTELVQRLKMCSELYIHYQQVTTLVVGLGIVAFTEGLHYSSFFLVTPQV